MKVVVRKVKYPRIDLTGDDIVVIVPPGTDPNEVLETKRSWIEKTQARKRKILRRVKRDLKKGIPILDARYSVVEDCREPGIYSEAYEIHICPGTAGDLKQDLKTMLRLDIATRVIHYSQLTGLSPRRIFIKDHRSKWGSCSSKGNLNFNLALVFMPESFRNYIVLHEMLHLRYPNHGRGFKKDLGEIYGGELPDREDMLYYWYLAREIRKKLALT